MELINDLKMLMSMSIEEIISSTHSLTLLKVYSKLYLNGTQPTGCEESLRKYYSEIKRDYKMKNEVLKRICIPAFDGRRYIPGAFDDNGKLIAGHMHIIGKDLTDKQAVKFLELGILSENDFIKLPYEKKDEKEMYTKNDIIKIIEKDNYKELDKAARYLKLITKRESKENTLKALKDYLTEDKSE